MPLDPVNETGRRAQDRSAAALRRAGWFTVCLFLVLLVGDGWSGRPGGLRHQLLLLPFTGLFGFSLWKLLFSPSGRGVPAWSPRRAIWVVGAFELLTLALFAYEARHFSAFGYRLQRVVWACALVLLSILVLAFLRRQTPGKLLALFVSLYGLGVLVAIFSFPLNYLRSDMLPVILWADTNLLHHLSPYATLFVGGRVYDFPYLPGMLVAYLPFVAARLDLRYAAIAALALCALFLYKAARPAARLEVACLLGLFLLNPFLQYRHELYLQPHWLTLVGAFVLMQRGRWVWGAFVLGLGMAIYQFSWIVLPFVVLHAYHRRGWLESLKLTLAAAAGALLLVGPFLHSALARISNNSVSQWGRFEHAIADPINLSWWITFAIHPDKLLRLQALLMVAIFAGCVLRRRCATLEDTMRWTVVALTVFILCNSLVDGYFYLMLLVPMLLFTLIANGWLTSRAGAQERARVEREPASA